MLNITLNTIFISVFEEIYIFAFPLFLAGYFDFLKSNTDGQDRFTKRDYLKFLCPVFILAIASNFLHLITSEVWIVFLLSFLISMLLIMVFYRVYSLKKLLWVFAFNALGFLIAAILQNATVFLISLDIKDAPLVENVFTRLVITSPERVIEYIILFVIYLFKKAKYSERILRIFKKKIILLPVISIFLLNMGLSLYYTHLISNHTIAGLPFDLRIFVFFESVVSPFINLAAIIFFIIYITYLLVSSNFINAELVKLYIEILERIKKQVLKAISDNASKAEIEKSFEVIIQNLDNLSDSMEKDKIISKQKEGGKKDV